jgi:D-alanyl-D-alanine carboxypeptidase (penicillin-binding protein 5/6)
MNREAQALGLSSTAFANPIGLDDPGNYSSAADLAALAEDLLENPLFARIADSETAVLRSGDRPRRLTSRNLLLGEDPTVDGVKTGHTLDAGWVLVGSATRDGTQLVSVVLGARSEAGRDAETEKLLDYGFSLYRSESPVTRGEELADPKLDYRDERLPLIAGRAITVSAREGQPVETTVEAPDEVSGDIEEGEKLGEVVVTVDGDAAATAPLVAADSVEAATLTDKAVATVQNPVILIPAGAIVIVVGALLAARGRRRPEDGEEQPPSPPKRERGPRERTPEERRKMHDERMRRRREQEGRSR